MATQKKSAKTGTKKAVKTSTKKAAKTSPKKAVKTSTKKAAQTTASPQKDPKGGLTAAGRKAFAKKEGAHLRPGVQGAADTPEKMKRKGSFLRRHFANPRGPMEKDGEPTRLALSAHAWGEPVPKTMADAKKLAAKGAKLLERYHKTEETKQGGKRPAKAASSRKPTKPTEKPTKKSAKKRSAKA